MIRSDFYIYVIFRLDGSPCYVGKGCGRRITEHRRKRKTNPHLANIMARANNDLPSIKVRENLTEVEAYAIEVALIAAIGRGKKGPLVNLTDGGDGRYGHSPSEQTREKLRAAHRDRSPEASRSRAEKISRFHKGKPKSPETRAKMSAAKANMTPEQRSAWIEKISAGHTGKTLSPEHRAKIKQWNRNLTAEQRQRRAENFAKGNLIRWAS